VFPNHQPIPDLEHAAHLAGVGLPCARHPHPPGLVATNIASTATGLLAASTQPPELPPDNSHGKLLELPDRAEELARVPLMRIFMLRHKM